MAVGRVTTAAFIAQHNFKASTPNGRPNQYLHPLHGGNQRPRRLADFIARQDPETTPIISSAGKAKATQTLHEWNRDALRAPNADNAAIDGDDASASAKTLPTELATTAKSSRTRSLCRVAPRWWTRQA